MEPLRRGASWRWRFWMGDADGENVTGVAATIVVWLSQGTQPLAATTLIATETGRGWYYVTLTRAQTNTTDLVLTAVEPTCRDTREAFYLERRTLDEVMELIRKKVA